jgi:hypothetical protein
MAPYKFSDTKKFKTALSAGIITATGFWVRKVRFL